MLILDYCPNAVFPSFLIVTAFTNSSFSEVIKCFYFYFTQITNTVHLLCKFHLQNRAQQNRTEQNRTEQNRTEKNSSRF